MLQIIMGIILRPLIMQPDLLIILCKVVGKQIYSPTIKLMWGYCIYSFSISSLESKEIGNPSST